jgi:DNA invertase Pin-like site-specific DNA recombinase
MSVKRAAKYKRISADREGRELGVGRQDEDLDALAERLGVLVVADYEDNDISASTRSRKLRPDYDRMLRDARAGVFEVILAYTSGRLTRRPREHEDLIELAERHGVQFVYVRSPSFDLTTAQGRRIARTLAAQDAGEAEEISERVQRAVRQRAERGEHHGGLVPFGQDTEEHAEWIREAVRRLLAGETLYGICTDWNKQGRRTRKGCKWRTINLRRAVLKPGIVGLREYEGTHYPAPWPAIVELDDWESVASVLTDPARTPKRGAPNKYILSGLVFCARCGGRLNSSAKGTAFNCALAANGCGGIRINMAWLDRYITEQVFATVDDHALAEAAAPARDDRERELRDAIKVDRRALESLADERDDGLIEDVEYRRRRKRITDRLERAESDALAMSRTRARIAVPPGDVLRREWAARDNAWRRRILAAVIERIDIGPHPAGVTTTPPRRRGETDTALTARRERHMAEVLRQRASITWAV